MIQLFIGRDIRHMRLASLISKKSLAINIRFGAVIAKGNKILGIGFNNPDKSHPAACCYSQKIHAEHSAILNADNPANLNGATIYVWRTNRLDNKRRISRPCHACYAMLKKYGIKDMVYTTDFGVAKEVIK